jgi:prepilin-type N-terminal cleavage/methylation domain-containing protein
VIERLRAEESGFTLVELIAAMAIGTVVLLAGFLLLDRATSVSNEIADRQDALQRGRIAMESMVQQLRSQVCLGDAKEPITFGEATTIRFYADLGDGGPHGDTMSVEERKLFYDPATKQIVEERYQGTGTYPDVTFPASATRKRVLLSKADLIKDGAVTRPLFRYYAFREGGAPGELEQLPVPLSTDDAARTVMVKLGFVSLPQRTKVRDRDSTTFESDVYVRIADPSKPTEGPRCL